MKLYHGSKYIIKTPIYKGSNEHNDYGPAFYMTTDLKAAQEWAGRNDSVGIVNEYKINIKNLKILDLTNKDEYSVLTWLAILMHNRNLPLSFKEDFKNRLEWLEKNYYVDVNQYDIVIGFRADDAYFAFPLEFIRGNLTYDKLENIYLLGNLGKQIVIMSKKAIGRIKFVNSFESNPLYINKYKERIDDASKTFRNILNEGLDKPGIRIGDIINDKHV